MDYASLVNLALITVVYSTFIAPNIQKLSKIKESILETEFPAKVTAEGSEETIKQNGVLLSKKFAQYSSKYSEIQSFLKYFYVIVAVLIAYQLFRLWFIVPFSWDNIVLLACSVIIICILAYSINTYMSHPSLIRSLSWLTWGGIAPVYLKHMYDPLLAINLKSQNDDTRDSDDLTFRIRSDVGFRGFNYVLTVESPDSRYLYYVNAGKATKFHNVSTITFENGHQGSEITLGKVKLKPGSYRVRLLFNGGFFSNIQPVHETLMEFTVGAGTTGPRYEKLLLGDRSQKDGYWFKLDKKNRRVQDINVSHHAAHGDESIERLLVFKPFQRNLRTAKRAFEITDVDGQIDKDVLKKALSRRNVWKARLLRIITKLPAKHDYILRLN